MLDFASSLYLGLRHGSRTLDPWDALSLGRPAALDEPADALAAAQDLAALVGCSAGTLLPSTFHLFWDLLGVLSREPIEIFMDASTYPIARWGAEHWAAKGVPLRSFARHDPTALARLLARRRGGRPVVLSDGVCPGSNSQPPLAAYAALARRHGGWLLIDDTQALGIYGGRASALAPYGVGGGGSLPRHGLAGNHLIVGASLAKGFGVPVALLAGSAPLLRRFERDSASREHMSPPSLAVIHAAQRALAVNRCAGERLRQRLWRAVQRLRSGLAALGLATRGGNFPVQTLVGPPQTDVLQLHTRLLQAGVNTVLHRDRGGGARLSFLVRAEHGAAQIDHAVAQLARAWDATWAPA
jgi:8-amino-7-oxononanoate synthase